MSFDWSHYLDLAQDLFTQAASSPYEDANLRSAISHAYYATYHNVIQEQVVIEGYRVPGRRLQG